MSQRYEIFIGGYHNGHMLIMWPRVNGELETRFTINDGETKFRLTKKNMIAIRDEITRKGRNAFEMIVNGTTFLRRVGA